MPGGELECRSLGQSFQFPFSDGDCLAHLWQIVGQIVDFGDVGQDGHGLDRAEPVIEQTLHSMRQTPSCAKLVANERRRSCSVHPQALHRF